MKKYSIISILLIFVFSNNIIAQKTSTKMKNKTFYDFSAKSITHKTISMSEYKGKVILVVNTASKCAYTPQYEGLENLYSKYKKDNFVVLGFPSNQFLNQEPGSEKEIASTCLLNYGVNFPMFAKIDVNGKNAHPIYKFLKKEKKGLLGKRIRWNFSKFLLDKEGNVIKRFPPRTTPAEIEKYIVELLDK